MAGIAGFAFAFGMIWLLVFKMGVGLDPDVESKEEPKDDN